MKTATLPCPLCSEAAQIEGVTLSPSVTDDSDCVVVRGHICRLHGYFLTVPAYRYLTDPARVRDEDMLDDLIARIRTTPEFASLDRPITVEDCKEAERAARRATG